MTDVIKEFFVGLSFDVDQKSFDKFKSALKSAGVKVLAVVSGIQIATGGVLYSFAKISQGFEQMGYDLRLIAPAIYKELVLRRELMKAYAAAGVNLRKAAIDAIHFNMSLAKTQFILQALYKGTAAKFLPLLTKQMDMFRKQIYANLPKIKMWLESGVKGLFKAFEATYILGQRLFSILGRVFDFFKDLHKATNGWSTALIGIAAAIQFIGDSFLATPLGAIITGLVAILALYDDFKTFQEGGKSLFDWKPFIPVITAFNDVLMTLKKTWQDIVEIIGNVALFWYQIFKGDSVGAVESLNNVLQAFKDTFTDIWDIIKKTGSSLGEFFSFAGDSSRTGQFFGKAMELLGGGPPVGSNSNTTSNIHAKTDIYVQGSASPEQTGRAVAQQQTNVHRDLVRNTSAAAR